MKPTAYIIDTSRANGSAAATERVHATTIRNVIDDMTGARV